MSIYKISVTVLAIVILFLSAARFLSTPYWVLTLAGHLAPHYLLAGVVLLGYSILSKSQFLTMVACALLVDRLTEPITL